MFLYCVADTFTSLQCLYANIGLISLIICPVIPHVTINLYYVFCVILFYVKTLLVMIAAVTVILFGHC